MEALPGSGPQTGRLPPFTPSDWVGEATRHVDVTEATDPLLQVLASQDTWQLAAAQDAQRQELVRQLASTLRSQTPLYELTAALVAPYLVSVLNPTSPDEGTSDAARGNPAVLRDTLLAAARHLFSSSQASGYDPWIGLAEWVWSHQTAWASAAIQQQIGRESIRALTADQFRRLLADQLRRSDQITLRERSGQFLLTYAQELAKVVVNALSLESVSSKRREILLGLRPARTPAEALPPTHAAQAQALAPLLQDNHLRVMSSAHYQALREALYKRAFVQVEGNPWPTAQLTKGGILGRAQLRPTAADGQEALAPEQVDLWATAMWRQREELSDLDADALDALSALWLYQARGVQDRAVADVDGLLAMRGIKPRSRGNGHRAGYEREQRAEMLRAVAHIQNLWIDITVAEDHHGSTARGGHQPTKRVAQSRAFVVTDRVGQVDLSGYLDVDKFVFRPGEVFAHFLLGPGSQTALLSAMALKYDPYRETWEKRLARYLSWQWRTRARGAQYQRPFRAATLLDTVGKGLDERRPAVTRERLEKALDALQRDGVIAGWQYDRWEEGLTHQRGWGKLWLEATLLIEPPEAIKEHYQPIERHRPQAPAPALPPGLGGRIKARRKELDLNQAQAGEALGVTQPYVSMLERDKVTANQLSPALRKRIEAWLED